MIKSLRFPLAAIALLAAGAASAGAMLSADVAASAAAPATSASVSAGTDAYAGGSMTMAARAQSDSTTRANPMVGGAPMLPSRNIVENAVNSQDHTTLVAAVQAAGLVEALGGEGPFTVFAPVNRAFANLPEGVVETLLQPENRGDLVNVLTYHVVPGAWTAAEIKRMVEENDGVFIFEGSNGTKLSAQVRGDTLYIGDRFGNNAVVTIGDVMQSNGVIHVIDRVLLPM